MTFKITWKDHGREPQCAPNPEFPKGRDVDAASPGDKACKVDLPYPAPRCGVYVIECSMCGIRVVVTTAGRPDDPKTVRFACLRTLQ